MILTKENYFSADADYEYMGTSQFKQFEKCSATAMAILRGEYIREVTVSMLIGSYVDAYFEGSLDKFKTEHPEIFKRDGSLKSEFVHAEQIIERIERDAFFMKQLSGEKQVVMTGTISGVKVKIKVDSLLPDRIVDLKIMKDFSPIFVEGQGRLPWFEAWRYDLQGAIYQEIVRQNTGEKLPFYLAAATSEKTPNIDVFLIEDDLLEYELSQFKTNAPAYDAMKKGVLYPERCERCDYCKATKVLSAENIIRSGDLINE